MRSNKKLKMATGFVALFLVGLLLMSSVAIAPNPGTPPEPPQYEKPSIPQNPIMSGQFGQSRFNYTNGMILLETPELSVRITAMQQVLHFMYWNTSDPSIVYNAKFVSLFEFVDSNNDSVYQANETVPRSVVPLSTFMWDFTGFQNITDENDNVIGVMFGYISTKVNVPFQPDLHVAIYCYLFYEDAEINGISVNGLTELKFTIEISNWTWVSNESLLGVRFDLSWSNASEGEGVRANVGGEEAPLGTNTTGQEKPLKNETQRSLRLEYEEDNKRTIGYLDYISEIVVDGENSTMTTSYAVNGNMLTVYFAYPHFDYYLTHDPTIGITSETSEETTETTGTEILPGNTIITVEGIAVTDTMLVLGAIVVLVALAVLVKSKKS